MEVFSLTTRGPIRASFAYRTSPGRGGPLFRARLTNVPWQALDTDLFTTKRAAKQEAARQGLMALQAQFPLLHVPTKVLFPCPWCLGEGTVFLTRPSQLGHHYLARHRSSMTAVAPVASTTALLISGPTRCLLCDDTVEHSALASPGDQPRPFCTSCRLWWHTHYAQHEHRLQAIMQGLLEATAHPRPTPTIHRTGAPALMPLGHRLSYTLDCFLAGLPDRVPPEHPARPPALRLVYPARSYTLQRRPQARHALRDLEEHQDSPPTSARSTAYS